MQGHGEGSFDKVRRKMKQRFIVWSAVMILWSFTMANAAVWYVHPDSSLNSIQAGLDSCAAYDTVLVGPGIYYENIDWPYLQGINLISEHGPDSTIIDGQESSGVICLSLMPEDSTTLIHGFTIRNGATWSGGGIYSVGGKPTISGNVITGNTCQWPTSQSNGPPPRGGGIYTEWSSPLIIDNVITDNIADEGGGVASLCDAANIAPKIFNNTISANSAHIGGGIFIDCPFTMTVVRENTISSNTADFGGGIACYYVFNPLLAITKNMIVGNIADSAGGGIWCYLASMPFIDSCVISENTGDGIYCGHYSLPVISYNNITDNQGFGLRNVDPTELVIAENNWWGDATGPYNPATNPGGLGDTVSDYVDYDPWLSSPGTAEHEFHQPVLIFLEANPNPFRLRTNIRYMIEPRSHNIGGSLRGKSERQKPELRIYDATGRLVKSVLLPTAYYLLHTVVSWDGTDGSNRKLGGGVYFLRLVVGNSIQTKKLVLLR